MKIKEIEKSLNRKEFKEKVEKLFCKEISKNIEFDFIISVSLFHGKLLKISAVDNSLGKDIFHIPRKKTKGCPVIYYWGEFCCFCS